MRREESFLFYLRSAGIFFSLVFALSPFLYMVAVAFTPSPRSLLEEGIRELTTDHFLSVLFGGNLHFLRYLANSLLVSAVSALFSVTAASLAAYGVTRFSFRGRRLFLMVILAASLFPPVSLVSYLFSFLSSWSMINTFGALVLPYVAWTMPLSLWILVSYFSQIPRDLDRAALMDGCSRFTILFRIILPVATPGIVSTALLVFLFSFNEFLFALMFTTDFRARTIPVGIALFEGQHGSLPWGEIMAAATLSTLPVVLVVLLFQKRIIQGLTRGAVKE